MLTPAELKTRVDRLIPHELTMFERQVGVAPKCKCAQCQIAWMHKVNQFLRAAEASRN